MVVFVVIIAVLVSVGLSVYRAKKIEQQRKEEQRKREQKYAPKPSASAKTVASAPAAKQVRASGQKREDPFPAYRADPFGEASEKDGCMTAKEYGDWLRAFRRADERGAVRSEKSEKQPVFARYLHTSGFNYRSLRKACGFAPQNRLHGVRVAYKQKPTVPSDALRNEGFTPDPPEQKTPRSALRVSPRLITDALAQKSDAHTALQSFYQDIA